MSGLFNKFQGEVSAWASATFGESTPDRVLTHLEDEVRELRAALERGDRLAICEEAADVHLLLLRLASMERFSLYQASERKLAVNRTRTWGEPDERGIVRHVEDAPA
ncbi:MAG: dATP/dGTP pyrophosphohydrolase domain-containing protein [Dehalococcoidia bacterium]